MLKALRASSVAVLIAVWFGFGAQSQESLPQTPQVQSEQQPNSAAERQPQSDQQTGPADQKSAIDQHDTGDDAKRKPNSDAEKRAEEAREFWPFHIFGARLKITDSLLALFTFLLIVVGSIQGIFLYRTDQGTHKAASAALLNAQAVIDAERAHLFVVIELENIAAMVSNAARAISDGSNYALRISYAFKNYGRTPAIIRAIGHGAIIAPELPQERTLSVVVHLPAHILGADEKSRPISDIALPRMTTEIAKSILDLDSTFWFYGYVVYDDTFGWHRTLSFVWHYDGGVSEGFTLFRYEETEKRRDT